MLSIKVQCIVVLSCFRFVPGRCQIPTVLCSVRGVNATGDPQDVAIDKIPPGCQGLVCGVYYMDDGLPARILKTSLILIRDLIKKDKRVYTRVAFNGAPQWVDILNTMPDDRNSTGKAYDTFIKPMLNFVTDNQISGVILDPEGMFDGIVKKNYAAKLQLVLFQMRKAIPTLTIGLVLNGNKFDHFSRTDLCDFNLTNGDVDHYVIDMISTALTCDTKIATDGRFPMASLEKVAHAVHNSRMDQTKIMLHLLIGITVVKKIDPEKHQEYGIQYSEYCNAATGDIANSPYTWCLDSSKMIFNQGEFARNNYEGLMLSYLDDDDWDGSCNCVLYMVAYKYINAWNNKVDSFNCTHFP